MRTRLVFLFLLLTAPSALAADRWVEVQTDHFRVVSNSSEKDARNIAAQFERMRAVFTALMPSLKSSTAPPLTVLALKDRRSFASIEPADAKGFGKLDLAGLFLTTSNDQHYILVRLDGITEQEHPFATVYHEYTHYLNRTDKTMPIWLNEGIAQFYENSVIGEKQTKVGDPSANDIYYLREEKLIPLATLFAVDHNSPYYHEEHKGSIFYAESWALTHMIFMVDYPTKAHRLTDYDHYVRSGEDPVAAATHAFGDLGQLEKDLKTYIHNQKFGVIMMTTPIEVDEASFNEMSIPTTDADSIRAAVLISDGREKEGQALVNSVLQQDPGNILANETLGFLGLYSNTKEGAEAASSAFAEAIKLGSKNHAVYYYYATLNMDDLSSGTDAKIEASLRTSIKLDPGYAPAYDALARFYAMHNRNLDDAHILSLQAVQLDPTNMQYRINGARVFLLQGTPVSVGNAVRTLETAMKVAKKPEDIAALQQELDDDRKVQAALATGAKPGIATTLASAAASADSPAKGTMTLIPRVHYPEGPATGPHHTISGVIKAVKCINPNGFVVDIDQPGKTLTLYANDYAKVDFYAVNFKPKGNINPCSDLQGRTVQIDYAEVQDKTAAEGQLLRIDISK